MSRSPNRKTRNKNITEYQVKSLQEWLFLLKVLDRMTLNVVEDIFVAIKNGIAEKSLLAIVADNSLASHDENIYHYYKRLMSYYSRTIDMYEDNKSNIQNENIKKIFDGIYAVIISRIKIFDERYGSDESNLDTNPITLEKNKLIENNTKLYSKNFDVLKTKFMKNYLNECVILARQSLYEKMHYDNGCYVAEQIVKIVQDCLAENLYKIYEISVKNAISNLNDLQLRSVTAYYHDILKEEKEILSSIIKIQITALEREIEVNHSGLEEKTILFNMLSNFREGYQYLGKEINDIMEFFNEIHGSTTAVGSYEDFLEDLREMAVAEQILPLVYFDEAKLDYGKKITLFQETFAQSVRVFLEKELNSFNINKSIYHAKRGIVEHASIANEMLLIFQSILDSFATNPVVNDEFNEILQGIQETLLIKVETIEDAKKYFLEESNGLLVHFEGEKMRFTEDDIVLAIQNSFEIWNEEMLNCPKKEEEAMVLVEKIFTEILKCDSVYRYRERVGKKYTGVIDSINKKILNYKKDSLLFEVSTFEEIMNYSVSRMRNAEEVEIKSYVAFMDNKVSELQNILKRNNIEIIKPEQHDMFNGKEHEVLMAEKKEGFAKGEIVKLMNCGYKQSDVVIVRANVIAAK